VPDWRPFMKHLRQPIIVVDTETTGLFSKHRWAEVWDLAAVLCDEEGRILSEFQAIIKRDEIPPQAAEGLKISGLTIDGVMAMMAAEGESLGDVVERFEAWMKQCDNATITSFNTEFDRAGIQKLGQPLHGLPWGPCVMKTAMAIMGPSGKLRPADKRHRSFNPRTPWLFPKQSACAEHFGVPLYEPAHRAMADCKTAAGIWHAIRLHAEAAVKESE